MKDKIKIEIPLDEAKLLRTWIGNTDIEYVEELINKYKLNIDSLRADEALYELWNQLDEKIKLIEEKDGK